MHSLLKRQLKRLQLSPDEQPSPEEWAEFLANVEKAYAEADKDRYLLERSLSLSSEEMQTVYRELHEQSTSQIAAERDLLQTVIKGMGEGLCALDETGKLIFMNDAARALLRCDEAELKEYSYSVLALCDSLRDLAAPAGIQPTNLARLRAGTQIYEAESRCYRPDGSHFPASYRINPIMRGRQLTGAVLLFRDTSAELQIKRSLAQRNLVLEQINTMAREMASTLDTQAIINTAVRTLAEILDVTSAYIGNWHAADNSVTVVAEYYTEHASAVERQSDLGAVYQLEYDLGIDKNWMTEAPQFFVSHVNDINMSTQERNHLLSYGAKSVLEVVLRVKGRPLGILELWESRRHRDFTQEEVDLALGLSQQIALAIDNARLYEDALQQIEERRQAQNALVRSERRYRLLAELIPDPVIVIASTRKESYVNPAFEALFGWQVQEIMRNPTCFIPFAEMSQFVNEWQEIDPQRSYLKYDATRFTRDGKVLEVEVSSVRYRSARGYDMVISVLRDITERNAAAAALAEARDAAESANRAKSTFLANMSHELRTPLTAIIGYSELLQELSARDGFSKYASRLKKIEVSAHQLLSIISGVLDLSKIEAGRMELFQETFDLHDVIAQVLDIAETLIAQQDNKLTLAIDPEIGQIHADSSKVRQILLNLLSNAAKFTRNGNISLTARMERRDDAGLGAYWLVIEVADDGIGMSSARMESLFEPFIQADASTTKQYGGTGLGLSISRSFAQMMQGTLTAQSEPDQGSIFTLTLPQPKWEPATAPPITQSEGS
ncbi:MAG: PAS domain S-box protein [Anaerolineales bacterium]|nr:PAS domain S-box protein [Anaerolineales bacterium]